MQLQNLPLGMEDHVEKWADVQQSPRLIPVPVGAVKEEEVTSLQYLDWTLAILLDFRGLFPLHSVPVRGPTRWVRHVFKRTPVCDGSGCAANTR